MNPKLSYNRALAIFDIPGRNKKGQEKISNIGYKVNVIDDYNE